MILVSKLGALSRQKANLSRDVITAGHASANSGLSTFSKALSINIFGNEARNMAIVVRNMLLAHLVLMTRNPSGGISAAVSKHIFEWFVFRRHVLEGHIAV